MLVPLLLSGIAFIIGFEAYLSPFVNYSSHAARRGRRNLRISSKIQPSYNFRYMLQAADSIAALRMPGGGIYILYNIYKSPPPPPGRDTSTKGLLYT